MRIPMTKKKISPRSKWFPICAAAGIGIIAADNVHDFLEQTDQQAVATTRIMTCFSIDISDLSALCQDNKLRGLLAELATKCKYSDPVSIPET
jgi:hypothetical protein